jgi:hypothetical protein
VEREFGRLKHGYGLAPLRVRSLECVPLYADLVMLARLSQALKLSANRSARSVGRASSPQ